MKILKLTLHQYRRLLLRNVTHFEISPTHLHQLIIGSNMSGKSSVMRELSPLPAVAADYAKGGYKEVDVEHGNTTYRLRSEFKVSGGHHSIFLLNAGMQPIGSSLNPGGTFSVQKELVKQLFGLDYEILELLLGELRFTQMAPSKRREWILTLSGNDLDYALKVYQELKTKARDATAIVKHTAKRLADEASKMMPVEELEEITRQCEGYRKDLHLLIEAKTPINGDTEQAKHTLKQLMGDLKQAGSKARLLEVKRPVWIIEPILSQSQLDTKLSEAKWKIDHLSQSLNDYLDEQQKLNELLSAYQQSTADGVNVLEVQTKELIDKRDKLLKQLGMFGQFKQAASHYGAMQSLYGTIIDLLQQMPSNEDKRFTTEKFQQQKINVDKYKESIAKITLEVGRLEHQIKHIEQAEDVNCPKCSFKFNPAIGQYSVDQIRELITAKFHEIGVIENQITEATSYLDEAREYSQHRKNLIRLKAENPAFTSLWDEITDRLDKESPMVLMSVIEVWRSDVEISWQIEELETKITYNQLALDHTASLSVESSQIRQTQLESLDSKINSVTAELTAWQKRFHELKVYGNEVEQLTQIHQSVGQCVNQIQEAYDRYYRLTERDMIDALIESTQTELSRLDRLRQDAKEAQDRVNGLELDRLKSQRDLECFTALLNELSPTDGLISDQIRGFILELTEQLNEIIDQVWTSKMTILPCGQDGEELDWKFPVFMSDSELTTPDIEKSSKGQGDIIDFAFKLVAMLYLGFDDYPLFLDELAPSLDEQHRINVIKLIQGLGESKKYSQLFMISHYITGHGSFTNAEVCVMSTTNIVNMPAVYNKHVVMR